MLTTVTGISGSGKSSLISQALVDLVSALYILDEPTTGLHPSDVERLMVQLDALVDAGNTVVLVEHDMRVAAASDHVIDVGPGAGDEGGTIVASGPPASVAKHAESRTAPYLARALARS